MAASTLEITKDGDEYTMKTISSMKTIETKFKLDQEFDDKLMDGRECRVSLRRVYSSDFLDGSRYYCYTKQTI